MAANQKPIRAPKYTRSRKSITPLEIASKCVKKLNDAMDDAAFADLAHVLYDQAMLAEGGELDDPAIFVRRVNRLIVEGLSAQPKIILS